MDERRHTSLPVWALRISNPILLACCTALLSMCLFFGNKWVERLDIRLASIEVSVSGIPVIQDRVAVLWRKARME